MLRPIRALLLLMALGAGCASQTIDLLAPPEGELGGSSGAPVAGTRAGSPPSSSGAGGRGGNGGVGGAGPRGGTGSFSGGTGNVVDGGASGEGGADGEGGAAPIDCAMNIDCPMSAPFCVPLMNAPRSHCVECVRDVDCGPGQNCDEFTNSCAPACLTFEQCPFELPFCERGVCLQCQTDSQCGPNVCWFGHCEECRSPLDCPPSAPVCTATNTCRPCTGMFMCGQYRYCDLTTGRCEPF